MPLVQAVVLQKYWRRWLARRRVQRLSRERDVVLQWIVDDAERRKQVRAGRRATGSVQVTEGVAGYHSTVNTEGASQGSCNGSS